MLQDAVSVVAVPLPRDVDELRLHRAGCDIENHLVVLASFGDEAGQNEVVGGRACGDVGGLAEGVLAFGDATHGGVVRRAAEAAVDVDGFAQKLAGRVEDVVDQGFGVCFGFGREPAATLAAQLRVGKVFHIFWFLVLA